MLNAIFFYHAEYANFVCSVYISLPILRPVYTGDFVGDFCCDFVAISNRLCKLVAIPQRFESPWFTCAI